jgi:hypothetical protein
VPGAGGPGAGGVPGGGVSGDGGGSGTGGAGQSGGGSNGIPTVQQSFPPSGGDGRITITVGDSDGDGDNEIRVDVPQSLNHDLKINVNAKIGDDELSGKFEVDVPDR